MRCHIENLKLFGLPIVVAVNHFSSDTPGEIAVLADAAASQGVEAITCRHWAEGSAGTEALAHKVAALADGNQKAQKAAFAPLYPDALSLMAKIETVARDIYRAGEVQADPAIRQQLKAWEAQGFGHLPVCIAKTQYSFSTDPTALGAPEGHTVTIRDVRLSAGAGFVVVLTGQIMTMPGLPRQPAAETIRLDQGGLVEGLF